MSELDYARNIYTKNFIDIQKVILDDHLQTNSDYVGLENEERSEVLEYMVNEFNKMDYRTTGDDSFISHVDDCLLYEAINQIEMEME